MERVVNNSRKDSKEHDFGDPRIESPEIKVIYPKVDRLVDAELTEDETKNSAADPTLTVSNITQTVSPNEAEHVCTITLQEAIKQNLYPLLGGTLLLLIIGYLTGKK